MNSKIVSIRCAHQKFNDFNIELDLKWTVLDLKRHVASTYPSKPAIDSQRLIFAGQLMKNETLVSNYLNRLPDTEHPIIHLVCKVEAVLDGMGGSSPSSLRQRRVPQTNSSTFLTSAPSSTNVLNSAIPMNATMNAGSAFPAVQSTPDMFGLHHSWSFANYNHPGLSSVHAQYANAYINQYYQYLQQVYGASQAGAAHPQFMNPMFQNMPPFSTAGSPMAPNSVGAAPAQQVAAPGNAGPNVQQHAPVAMNAQGGMVDDEEGLRHNDWLDWVYTLFRASFLLLILFSYSSMERMTFVLVIAALLFAYHNGWFSRRQRPPRAANDDNNNNRMENRRPNGEPAVAPVAASQQEQPVQVETTSSLNTTPDPSAWHVFWSTCYTFVSSFFSSLIPEHPQVGNF